MSNELQVAIPDETQNQSEEPTQSEVVTDATDGATKPAEPAKTAEQVEIERLRRALTKRDRTQGKLHLEREQLAAELAELRQRQPAPQTDDSVQKQPADHRQAVEREALTLAERIAEQRAFAAKCNSVAETGKKDFKDFTDSLTALIEEAGPLVLPTGNATPLGEQILESESPAKLIDYLGKHPEIAAELDGLTPGRLARKLALIETEMAAKPKTSSAPKPLEPIKGAAGGGDLASVVDDPEEWRRRRNAQLKKR